MASINRGCSAISNGGYGGARTELVDDGITRAPCIAMPDIRLALELKQVGISKVLQGNVTYGNGSCSLLLSDKVVHDVVLYGNVVHGTVFYENVSYGNVIHSNVLYGSDMLDKNCGVLFLLGNEL